MRVCNVATSDAQQVVTRTIVPPGMQHLGFGSGLGLLCEQLQGNFSCTVSGPLRGGSCIDISFTVYIFSTQPVSTLQLHGWVNTSTVETAPADDEAIFDVSITLFSQVQFTQLAPVVTTAGLGQHYDMYVGNRGPSKAYGVVLTSHSYFPIQSWTEPPGTSCELQRGSNKTLVCNLGDLRAEQQGIVLGVLVSVVFQVPSSTVPTIRERAESPSLAAYLVDASFVVASPDAPGDNAQSYPIDVLRVSDLDLLVNCSLSASVFTLFNKGPSDCASYSLVIRPGVQPSQ